MYAEFELIDRIAARFSSAEGVTVGIGDDGAVIDPGRFDLVTTDTMVEGVHFRRDWSSAEDIGWKLMATNLSDIAAMGGGPGVAFLNLTLPHDERASFVDGLLEGLAQAIEALVPPSFTVSIAGGDVTSTSGPAVLTLTLMGESSPAGPVLRQGAVPGDRIVLFGHTGLSRAGLAIFSGEVEASIEDFPAPIQAHRRPRPRVHEGALLGLYGVPSALIDISDGLAQDLSHLLKRSRVGASIEAHNLPRHEELLRLCQLAKLDPLPWLISGGEDYELLVTVPPARMPKLWELARRYEWDVYDIGEIRAPEEGLRILGPKGQPLDLVASFGSLGYQHFQGST